MSPSHWLAPTSPSLPVIRRSRSRISNISPISDLEPPSRLPLLFPHRTSVILPAQRSPHTAATTHHSGRNFSFPGTPFRPLSCLSFFSFFSPFFLPFFIIAQPRRSRPRHPPLGFLHSLHSALSAPPVPDVPPPIALVPPSSLSHFRPLLSHSNSLTKPILSLNT